MKNLFITFIFTGLSYTCFTQTTAIWSEDFTTELTTYYSEYPYTLVKNDTINVIGRKNTANGQRLLIVKYDLNGDTISTQSYGDDSVLNNTLIDFKFDAFNHVYLLQEEKLDPFKSKIVIQKYALDGNLIWLEQITSPADTSYRPRSLGIANDTCIFVTAFKDYDYAVIGGDVVNTISHAHLYNYATNGTLLWKREFNPSTELSGFSGNLFIHDNILYLFSNGSRLLKIDINNNLLLNIDLGLTYGVGNIQLTSEMMLLITSSVNYRVSIVSLDGIIVWTEDYSTNLPSNISGDQILATIQDADGNIYVTGRHYGDGYDTPSYSNADILTLKYNNSGLLIWQNRYEYEVNNADIAKCIALKNGSVYIGGQSQRQGTSADYDYLVLKMDAETGITTGSYRYNGIENGEDVVSSMYVFDDEKIALTGISKLNSLYGWTTQLLSNVVLSVPDLNLNSELNLFPNPLTTEENLTIAGNGFTSYAIVSQLGQLVQSGELEEFTPNTIQLTTIKKGVYLIHLATKSHRITRKIVVQ